MKAVQFALPTFILRATVVAGFLPNHRPARNQHGISGLAPTAPSTTSLFIFGNMFGGNSGGATKLDENGEATVYESSPEDTEMEFDGLSDYIQKWGDLFASGGIKLTTPVQVSKIIDDQSKGARLLFQSIDTGYKNKREEEKDEVADKKSNKKPPASQGGLDIVVERVSSSAIKVVARRCAIEEGTVIKEMSEERILKELNTAIAAWKKETSSK